jgi:putative tricarboxylic transport membrane protein
MGPKGLKPAEIAYWDATFAKLGQSEEWKKDAESQFWAAEYLLSADTRKHMETENELTKVILNDLGLMAAPPSK